MGFEDDELLSLDQLADDGRQEVPKKAKFTYSRDFLLSFRELDFCKQLPTGFDKSILNEFHDAFHGSQEKARASGGFVAQNFRHTEYSASPPMRRDANSYSRASTGKWESRSRDGDSQSDRDSESGRQYGTHSRRPRQNSEHDGLLGSGSSPKLTGITSGTSAPRLRANDPHPHHLNRSNAPYQPPRPYKAIPHSRTTTSDLHNDETFGSAEITSEDQAEEEKKRRAEFELMRKERYKSSQEKQYLHSADSKDDLIFDTIENEGNFNDEKKILSEGNQSLESSILAPRNASTKSSTSVQTPVPRPIVPPGFVPPGFANTSNVAKSAIKPDTKVQTSELNDNLVHVFVNSSSKSIYDDKIVKKHDDQSHLNTNNHGGTVELLVNGEELGSKNEILQRPAALSNQDFATPLLEDIFGNSLTINGGSLSGSTERPDGSLNDKWKGSAKESSKFAQWFVEDDGRRLEDGRLSEKPINLFSLVDGGPTNELISHDSNSKSKVAKTKDTSGPVLTCEDLEQSILSELSDHKVPSSKPPQGYETCDSKVVQQKAGIDALASKHLLSVLHKGPGPTDMGQSLNIGKDSADGHHQFDSTSMGVASDSLKQGKVGKTSDLSKNPTLEALFGSAFMKELQAVDAPVSTKRESFISDSSRYRLPGDENAITVNEPLNHSNTFHEHVDVAKNAGLASSQLSVGNPERLGVLSAMFRDGRPAMQSQENQAFPHNPFDKLQHNNAYHNIHAHPSPPQFPNPHMMGQGRPMFNQSDAHHPTPQMRFPDNMIRRDSPSTHQLSSSPQLFPQPKPMGFESSSQQLLMQQMHMQGNVPPPHLLRQYSGNQPQPPHPYNQVLGFRQELDPMQRFHAGRHQPGFAGLGPSPPVSDIGSGIHHPDALQQLMEMEMRSKAKPNNPFAGRLGGLPNF